MALPWGVKEVVDAEVAEELSAYFETATGQKIDCGEGQTAEILKAGVKERKGTYTLIYRYKLV